MKLQVCVDELAHEHPLHVGGLLAVQSPLLVDLVPDLDFPGQHPGKLENQSRQFRGRAFFLILLFFFVFAYAIIS